jgi:hypothetical protein
MKDRRVEERRKQQRRRNGQYHRHTDTNMVFYCECGTLHRYTEEEILHHRDRLPWWLGGSEYLYVLCPGCKTEHVVEMDFALYKEILEDLRAS